MHTRRRGFRGGINWYRNIDRNAREHPQIGVTKLTLPCLMITAEWDGALPPRMAAGMPALCADLRNAQHRARRDIGFSRSFPTR